MTRLALISFLVFALAGCSDSLVESYCGMRLGSPVLNVNLVQENYSVANDQTGQALAARLSPADSASPGHTVGLTTGHFEQALTYALAGVAGPGFACFQPRVDAILTLTAPRVFVARELDPDSCRYGEVLAHELRHVQAYQAQLSATEEALKQAFAERYPQGSYIRLRASADGLQLQATELNDWLVPFVSGSLAEVSARHRQLDSPEEYLRLSRACPHEPLP